MTPQDQNKGGRPPLEPGKIRKQTTVSLTHELQIEFRRYGGSEWLRKQIILERKRREANI